MTKERSDKEKSEKQKGTNTNAKTDLEYKWHRAAEDHGIGY